MEVSAHLNKSLGAVKIKVQKKKLFRAQCAYMHHNIENVHRQFLWLNYIKNYKNLFVSNTVYRSNLPSVLLSLLCVCVCVWRQDASKHLNNQLNNFHSTLQTSECLNNGFVIAYALAQASLPNNAHGFISCWKNLKQSQ